MKLLLIAIVSAVLLATTAFADPTHTAAQNGNLAGVQAELVKPPEPFLHYVRSKAAALRAGDRAPETLISWKAARATSRAQLAEAWGPFPKEACALNPKKLEVFERDGYRVEKIVFQTIPGVWMTSNAYLPDGDGPFPAVLCVHGHWSGAKQDPVVQSRCIGLAKLGFFVLAVDAFGAGERGVGKELGEYHGELVAATLIPTGRVLAGLQVYENTRALDYLQSRPEVDPKRLGVTGTSGGGNQSMYIGAWDERLGAVVPTCSVGTYQSYLGVACCMCEVVPGALSFTEEWRLLAMIAPRALMVSNATRDSIQFSVGEARKSVTRAKPVFELFGVAGNIRQAVFEAGHGYDQPMREEMYGWMTLHLKGEGDGSPIAEPKHKPEDRERLRCFPGRSRPDDWMTLPQFAASEARKLLAEISLPRQRDDWTEQRQKLRGAFRKLFGPLCEAPKRIDLQVRDQRGTNGKTALLLNVEGGKAARESALGVELRKAGWRVVTLDLRATGGTQVKRDRIGHALDHNSAEWSLWLGPTLLEQWISDVCQAINVCGALTVTVIGNEEVGAVALAAAIADERIAQVATVNSLASYVSDLPYRNQRLGIMVPGILREVGDIPHLAALMAPRRLLVAGAVKGGGGKLAREDLDQAYAFTRRVYELEKAPLEIAADLTPVEIIKRLTQD